VEEFHLLLEHYCIVVAHKRTQKEKDAQELSTTEHEPLSLS
jgi:hypothetical protein